MTTNEARAWREYDTIAAMMARKGLKGIEGEPLPDGISTECFELINADTDAFADRVRDCAYAQAMNRHNLSE